MRRRGLLVVLAALLAGCSQAADAPVPHRPLVVATTSLLASLAVAVTGNARDVASIVPVGASPETFEPTPADVGRLADARLILVNGAGLEAWFARTLDAARAKDARVITLTDGLPVRDGNPHLWLDPQFARLYVRRIRDGLIAVDPARAAGYNARAAAFDARLVALRDRIARRIATVPAQRRAMLVYHPAWTYYDARFGIRIIGSVQEQAGREPTPDHLARLVSAARAAEVHAVFTEPEYDPKLMRAVAESANIHRVVQLYDDSVGTSRETRDYVSMLDFDTESIVRGLR